MDYHHVVFLPFLLCYLHKDSKVFKSGEEEERVDRESEGGEEKE
jgi:hypothetical protein